jgi:hypothetical protein
MQYSGPRASLEIGRFSTRPQSLVLRASDFDLILKPAFPGESRISEQLRLATM